MTSEQAAFKNIQYNFTAHLRDPEHNTAPADIEDRRMEIYRGLFYRNVKSFIDNAFPVLRTLYNDDDWQKIVRDFYANHQSASPYFKDISLEFLTYLQSERETQQEDPVFIKELAHYEWLEVSLTFSDNEVDLSKIDTNGDLLTGIPIMSPLAEMHRYTFPVHKIKPSFQPTEPSEQAHFLMVHRNQQDEVCFTELNSISALLVEMLVNDNSKTGQELLDDIVEKTNHPNSDIVYKGGEQTLKQLRATDIILGTKIS
ncbi:MAG: HvfC family RiPP maturation protein [Gammaproteobacteria bacterium]